MCRWQAYSGPEIYMEDLIFETEHSLVDQSQHALESKSAINADGVGVGWYAGHPEPGLYRQTQPAWNDTNLRHLTHQVKSHLFFAHIRASTGTAVTKSNCHPYSLGNWMFMHNGKIGGYETVRRHMDAAIPDHAYKRRLGTTDSEAFFLMMFAHGIEENPAQAFRDTIKHVEMIQRDNGIEPEIQMAAALSDGEQLIAVRYSTTDTPPSLYWEGSGKQVILVSEPYDDDDGHWTEVPPQHVVYAEPSGISAVISLF